MEIFKECRPVIIAPCNMLLTWEEEFKKWKVDIPFHNLNSGEYSGKEDPQALKLVQNKPQRKNMNRMVKLVSWSRGKSILRISYQLFEKLAGEGPIGKKINMLRKFIHWINFMRNDARATEIPTEFATAGTFHGEIHNTLGWDAKYEEMQITLTVGCLSDLASDKTTLLALKSTLGGKNLNWAATDPIPCAWVGVKCENNRVTSLRLPGARLSGEIPIGIFGNLTHLHSLFTSQLLDRLGTLYLEKNQLTGSIPELYLPNLVQFNVSFNYLQGKIPSTLKSVKPSAFEGNSLCGAPCPN
ncbi:Leucine-rich repeat-containing N-terminal [Macleaya cordata]|uniref:Leucine-rich repeat-containing N-terminal n=1 Tax=Macleaya cordata TaxID=56857 RepID=A0A200QL84_MACCD|nr:Leucine-rich repeat-containing N-terminal [Macleaya cordata]